MARLMVRLPSEWASLFIWIPTGLTDILEYHAWDARVLGWHGWEVQGNCTLKSNIILTRSM